MRENGYKSILSPLLLFGLEPVCVCERGGVMLSPLLLFGLQPALVYSFSSSMK